MDFGILKRQSSPSYLRWIVILVTLIFLGLCFYEIFTPISTVSAETEITPYDRRVFRQVRGIGGIFLIAVLYNLFIYQRTTRFL